VWDKKSKTKTVPEYNFLTAFFGEVEQGRPATGNFEKIWRKFSIFHPPPPLLGLHAFAQINQQHYIIIGSWKNTIAIAGIATG
jgi:hypothetical protein